MEYILLLSFRYFAIRRNRANSHMRNKIYNLKDYDSVDGGYCLDNEAVVFREESKDTQ